MTKLVDGRLNAQAWDDPEPDEALGRDRAILLREPLVVGAMESPGYVLLLRTSDQHSAARARV